MSDWYQRYLVDTGRAAMLWLLLGFVVTYAVTRWVTLRIRSRTTGDAGPKGTSVKDVYIGGLHVHHQVWGILLVLVTGMLQFRFSPSSPWQEVLSALFGAGATPKDSSIARTTSVSPGGTATASTPTSGRASTARAAWTRTGASPRRRNCLGGLPSRAPAPAAGRTAAAGVIPRVPAGGG